MPAEHAPFVYSVSDRASETGGGPGQSDRRATCASKMFAPPRRRVLVRDKLISASGSMWLAIRQAR